jgi:hypothetical protein
LRKGEGEHAEKVHKFGNINCDSRKRSNPSSPPLKLRGGRVGLYSEDYAEPQIMDLFQHIRPSFWSEYATVR